jgi:hypothetical protein
MSHCRGVMRSQTAQSSLRSLGALALNDTTRVHPRCICTQVHLSALSPGTPALRYTCISFLLQFIDRKWATAASSAPPPTYLGSGTHLHTMALLSRGLINDTSHGFRLQPLTIQRFPQRSGPGSQIVHIVIPAQYPGSPPFLIPDRHLTPKSLPRVQEGTLGAWPWAFRVRDRSLGAAGALP